MDDFTIPGGLRVPLPRKEDFVLPTLVPEIPFVVPTPILPPVLPDRRTIEKAFKKGHDVIKGLFDELSKPPTRFIAEGIAIVTANAIHPLLGLGVAGTVAVSEGARLAGKIQHR